MFMKALSIRQPWAWLIVHGEKDIENRTWSTRYRGPVLIHAGKKLDPDFDEIVAILRDEGLDFPDDPPTGGIVGKAIIADCVTQSDSDWFGGPFGFVLTDASPLNFIPIPGRLGVFEVDLVPSSLTSAPTPPALPEMPAG